MAILFYQLGIFIVIQVAASFGKNSRNTAVVLVSIFTILQVFTSGLMILQFITIFVSYSISNSWFFSSEKKEYKPNLQPRNNITNEIAKSNIIFKTSDPFYDDDDGFSRVSSGGISKDSPILLNCEESKRNYIKKLLLTRSV